MTVTRMAQRTSELVLAGNSRVDWRITERPAPQGSQVLVRTEVVGICATDIALFKGAYAAPHLKPICFGHEWAGVVDAVGPDVRGLAPGDRVTGECSLWCGKCDRCSENKNLCRHIRKAGITANGAASEWVLFEERHLHRADQSLLPEILALTEPLAVCREAIIASGSVATLAQKRVLVVGGGMLGLGCALLLRRMFGAGEVFLHDIEGPRLKRAAKFDVEPLADLPEPREAGDYATLYGKAGAFDLILETTGVPAVLERSLRLLNPGGALVLLAFTGVASFAPRDLVINASRVVGSIGGTGSFEPVIAWLSTHADEASELVTHRYLAVNAMPAFETAQDRSTALKVQLRFAA
jgi:L-iditol 2-dehydrogenase